MIVDSGLSFWGGWENCNVTCGGGLQRRGRSCTSPTLPSNSKVKGCAKNALSCTYLALRIFVQVTFCNRCYHTVVSFNLYKKEIINQKVPKLLLLLKKGINPSRSNNWRGKSLLKYVSSVLIFFPAFNLNENFKRSKK